MRWIKKGLIYGPDGKISWAKKHAFPPTPYFINENTIRVYVAFCDENTVGRVGYVDISAMNPSEVLNVSENPVLDIGNPGAFDENGVLPTSVVQYGDKLYLYYVGYQLGHKVRYYQFQGLAISEDGGNSFIRYTKCPILDRSDHEMLNRTSAFVMCDNSFKMWYVGGSEWIDIRGKHLPVYNIRYLESSDGKKWGDEGRICIDFKDTDEFAFGRPFVIKHAGLYKMFYSVRTASEGYRPGYAESEDGNNWIRKDEEIGIEVSKSGWDSEMIAYLSIATYKDAVYMFYNGNKFGYDGFGYAVLEEW